MRSLITRDSHVVCYGENSTKILLLTTYVVFPVGASICEPFLEPALQHATCNVHVKNIPLLNRCPLLSD